MSRKSFPSPRAAPTEHLAQLVVQNMRQPALLVAFDGMVLSANRPVAQMLGMPLASVIGRPLRQLVVPRQRRAPTKLIEQCRVKAVRRRLVFRGGDGNEVPAYVAANALLDSASPIICIADADLHALDGPAKVLAELRRRQEALAESERRYRHLFEASPDAVAVLVDGQFVDLNPAAVRLWGATSAQELVGRPLLDLVHSGNWPDLVHASPQVQAEKPLPVAQTRIVRLDGELLDVEVSANVIRYDGRRAVQLIVRDMTNRRKLLESLSRTRRQLERRVRERTARLTQTIHSLRTEAARRIAAEQSLHQRSRLLEAFFRHSSTPLAFLDRHFNFIRVNEAYARACQRDTADFPGHNHFEFFPDAENQAIFEQVVRTKRTYETYGKPFVFPDHPEWGTTYWNWRLTPLLDDAGEVESLVFDLEDVTERTQSEQRLQALNQMLRRRTQQLRSLASDLTLAEQRERQRLARLLHDHLQQLLVGAKFRVSSLHKVQDPLVVQLAQEIDDLLTQSIAASRSLTAELSPPILHEAGLIAALQWLCAWTRDNHGLHVRCALDQRAEPQSLDIRLLLFQSVRELLLNVIKHSGVKTARLDVAAVDNQVQVVVSDDGQGFDLSTVESDRGSRGFGLFSIQERLDLIGGRFTIESAPGRGSRFTLLAPRARVGPLLQDRQAPPLALPRAVVGEAADEPSAAVDAQLEPERSAPARIRVLLVDDHAVTRQGLRRLLKHEPSIRVVGEAGDGLEAIAMVRRLQPDVVIMDVSMPGMSGIEATRLIRREFPAIRVIGLSMFAQEERGQEMRQAGAWAYFTKSGPPHELIDAICRCGTSPPPPEPLGPPPPRNLPRDATPRR